MRFSVSPCSYYLSPLLLFAVIVIVVIVVVVLVIVISSTCERGKSVISYGNTRISAIFLRLLLLKGSGKIVPSDEQRASAANAHCLLLKASSP